MKTFDKYIIEHAKEYSEDVSTQLAYRIGAEDAMRWVMANLEEIIRKKQGVN